MEEDAEEIPQNQIVLHEDKKYYASALEVECTLSRNRTFEMRSITCLLTYDHSGVR